MVLGCELGRERALGAGAHGLRSDGGTQGPLYHCRPLWVQAGWESPEGRAGLPGPQAEVGGGLNGLRGLSDVAGAWRHVRLPLHLSAVGVCGGSKAARQGMWHL